MVHKLGISCTGSLGGQGVQCSNGAFPAPGGVYWEGSAGEGGAGLINVFSVRDCGDGRKFEGEIVPGRIFVIFADYMIGFLKEYKRKKAFAAVLKVREGKVMQQLQFPTYEKLGTVGFLCALEKGGDPQMVADIVASFRRAGKPFRGMVLETGCVFKDSAAREEFAHNCRNYNVVFVDYSMFNKAGIPVEPGFSTAEEVKAFFDAQYDLFLNLNYSCSFTLDLLALGVDAKCLAGMKDNKKMPYSLIMEPCRDNFSFSRYIDTLFNYLKTINATQANQQQ